MLASAWTWTENVSYGRGEPYRWARLFAQVVADEHGVDSGSLVRRFVFTDDLSPETARRFGGSIAAIARDAAFSGWEDESADVPADPAEVTATLAEVAARYVDRLFESTGPRVVVIDDLHWLDPSSDGMVELVVETIATTTRSSSSRPPDPGHSPAGRHATRPPGYGCTAWPNPIPPGWPPSSLGRRSMLKESAASTNGPAGTRSSSVRPFAPSSRTARSSGGTAGWR